jgi:DNA processing protein
MDREEYWLWLTNINEMYSGKIKKILDFFDSPEDFYNASEKAIKKAGFIKEKDIALIKESKDIEKVKRLREEIYKRNIKFFYPGKEGYPKRLLEIYEIPYSLYVLGKLPLEEEKNVSVIGARNCSEYGRQIAKKLGQNLSNNNVNVISGMARGTDTYAHLGALSGGGKTYAILGSGVDICYPIENISMYEEIIKTGGVVSEYPIGSKPDAWRFPKRNRIISALSDAVIIVEAKEKSGSLITAEYALEQGKDVYAVPGRVNDVMSRGCNRLIRDGAGIIYDIDEVLNIMGVVNDIKIKKDINLNILLEKDFEVLYSDVDLLPISIEDLVLKTGFEFGRVYEILLRLQMEGLIYEPVKNYYARII